MPDRREGCRRTRRPPAPLPSECRRAHRRAARPGPTCLKRKKPFSILRGDEVVVAVTARRDEATGSRSATSRRWAGMIGRRKRPDLSWRNRAKLAAEKSTGTGGMEGRSPPARTVA